jgi:hypothetical protein
MEFTFPGVIVASQLLFLFLIEYVGEYLGWPESGGAQMVIVTFTNFKVRCMGVCL